jgi:hypothetical protein
LIYYSVFPYKLLCNLYKNKNTKNKNFINYNENNLKKQKQVSKYKLNIDKIKNLNSIKLATTSFITFSFL